MKPNNYLYFALTEIFPEHRAEHSKDINLHKEFL